MAYIGKQPVVGNFVKLDAIVTSATTTFNLLNGGVAYFPQSANNCIVSLNGIIQEPTSSGNVGGYTISGSTIVFTTALTTLDVIDFILVLGDTLSIGTPSDGTVGFAKVTSNLITGATSEATIAGGDSILIYDDSASALRKMTRTNFVSGIGGTNTPAFFAVSSSNQGSIDGVTVKVQFGSETFDTAGAYDPTTNYRFTVPSGQAGKYFISTAIRVSDLSGNPNTLSRLQLYIKKNGTAIDPFIDYDLRYDTYIYSLSIHMNVVLNLSVADYLEVFCFTDSTGNPGLVGGNCWFQGYKLIE